MVEATSSGSLMGASATKKTPPSNSSKSSAAACSPRRVLPVPPGPVSVSSRTSGRRRRPAISESSFSRPTNGVGWVGRLLILSSRVFKGGKPEGRSGERSWKTLSGLKRSFKAALCPRSLKDAPSGRSSLVSSCVAWERSTCPPWPAESSLATRLTGGPK